MRSPKGSHKYDPAQQDDYSDDDAGGGKGDRTPPSSDGERSDKQGDSSDEQDSRDEKGGRGKKKRGAAGAGQQDGEEDQQDEEESSNKKLWWIAAGVAVIVVLLLIGAWYWYSHRDSSSSSDSTSSSAVVSSAPATSSAALQPSTTAPAPVTTSPPSLPVTTSPLLTAQPTTSGSPTTTDTAVQPGQTFFAQITWFEASSELSECGTKAKDTDLVVRVSEELLEKDSYVRATIEGISGNITGHNLDLSQAAFKGLTSNLKLGTTLVQWYLTDDKHRPKASLKSYPVGGGGATETDETGGTVLTGAVMPTKAYEPAIMTVTRLAQLHSTARARAGRGMDLHSDGGSGAATPTLAKSSSSPTFDLPPQVTDLDLLSLASSSPNPPGPHFTHHPPLHSTYSRHLGDFPPEIIALIIHHLYYSYVPYPTPFPCPDPYLELVPATPYEPSHLAQPLDTQAKETLASICLVDKTWSAEATRALWRRVSFGMPRAFESVLRTIEEYSGGQRVARPLRSDARGGRGHSSEAANNSSLGLVGLELDEPVKGAGAAGGGGFAGGLKAALEAAVEEETRGRPLVSSPPEERHPLPSHHSAPVEIANSFPPPAPLPTLDPADSPLLFTRAISFARFRTAGMKRTLRQGSHERFVTPHRLVTLLKGTRYPRDKLVKPVVNKDEEDEEDEEERWSSSADESEGETPGGKKKKKVAGQLCQVGFSEYMDSAITFEVLEELLFRGGYLAEYEEPEEPAFMPDFGSSESDLGVGLRSPYFGATPGSHVPASPHEPFHYRHLASSHSRSPSTDRGSHRTRSSSISTSIAEEDETMVDTDDDAPGSGSRTPVGRRPAHWMQRRPSGSSFAPPASQPTGQMHPVGSPDEHMSSGAEDLEDEEEMRGRERFGRSRGGLPTSQSVSGLATPTESHPRGRPRFNRSLLPPHAFLTRSASLPAHAVPQLPQSLSRASERSSSVPASVSGRWAPEPAPKRTVQVLEGSLTMQPVRALDLCGCVSRVFVAGLEEFVKMYKCGPKALMPPPGMDTLGEEDEDDEMEMGYRTPSLRSVRMGYTEERILNRTFFPHLRRLGLASSLLPSDLLTSFVLSFPYLTHLDLASTLTSPMLLKGLALAGQKGIGGRPMRLKALSLARCRLITGAALLGLFCGDCPPLTTLAGLSDDEDESWGSGEVVSELTDLSLFGDGTYPSPLEVPELRLVVSASPAFRSGRLRTLDLSSTPMSDVILTELIPPQPNLMQLGLAHCRSITMHAVSTFLCTKANAVEILDLSHSCPSLVGQSISSRRRVTLGPPSMSIMELHAVLLSQCASLESSSPNPEEAQLLLALRQTNLRIVELDEKSLELVQGGAGDWKPVWGKGRRGWYVDTATTSTLTPYYSPSTRPRQLLHLPRTDTQRQALLKLVDQNRSGLEVAWNPRKMEVLKGEGMLGYREGLYAYHSFAS
ncbi:hypothetical protein OF846_004393 [Rhodotorula toruloides]|nr:hypothetical protein OF846_004393 [Rhodotorula toruloides]